MQIKIKVFNQKNKIKVRLEKHTSSNYYQIKDFFVEKKQKDNTAVIEKNVIALLGANYKVDIAKLNNYVFNNIGFELLSDYRKTLN